MGRLGVRVDCAQTESYLRSGSSQSATGYVRFAVSGEWLVLTSNSGTDESKCLLCEPMHKAKSATRSGHLTMTTNMVNKLQLSEDPSSADSMMCDQRRISKISFHAQAEDSVRHRTEMKMDCSHRMHLLIAQSPIPRRTVVINFQCKGIGQTTGPLTLFSRVSSGRKPQPRH